MVKFLQNFSFFGGLTIAVLGVIMILITNDTGHEPVMLKQVMTLMVFVIGMSVFLMLVVRSKANKK